MTDPTDLAMDDSAFATLFGDLLDDGLVDDDGAATSGPTDLYSAALHPDLPGDPGGGNLNAVDAGGTDDVSLGVRYVTFYPTCDRSMG